MADPKFPAAFTVHWATGPTPCCVKHARALVRLGAMLGTHVPATAAAEGAECENCINEAKRTPATDGDSNA